MKTITDPTTEQIEKALALVEKGNFITGDRYAMTQHGTFINHGNISTPKEKIKAIRYITVYGTTASLSYVLEGIDMYPSKEILKAGYTVVPQELIPNYFEDMETVIYEY